MGSAASASPIPSPRPVEVDRQTPLQVAKLSKRQEELVHRLVGGVGERIRNETPHPPTQKQKKSNPHTLAVLVVGGVFERCDAVLWGSLPRGCCTQPRPLVDTCSEFNPFLEGLVTQGLHLTGVVVVNRHNAAVLFATPRMQLHKHAFKSILRAMKDPVRCFWEEIEVRASQTPCCYSSTHDGWKP